MTRKDITNRIDKVLHERLFSAIKKLSVTRKRSKFEKTQDFNNAGNKVKKEMLGEKYSSWYKDSESFYLSFNSIFALTYLVKREHEIISFNTQEVTLVRIDYIYNGIEFSATFPTRYTIDMKKEVDDCIADLSDPKYVHLIDNYKLIKDAEKTPPYPQTNTSLKYSGFYLFQFEYKYTTLLATLLFNAGLITNINTSGWSIDDDVAEEIITVLNSKYKEEQVLQRKREYDLSSPEREYECIRPIKFSKEYFPKTIKDTKEFKSIEFEDDREEMDAFKLYEFIFYMTLSTQLNNSIYDASVVDISVGPKNLRQTANEIIPGHENWEILAGKYSKKLKENDNSSEYFSKTVTLPEFRQGDVLDLINVYPFSYNSRRPRRYGAGRFATQILDKNGIGILSEHDDIISNLIDSKAVLQIHQVLNPQEISLFLINWLKEYIPLLVDIEYLKEVELKIESILEGQLTCEALEDEINRLIDDGFSKAEYKEDTTAPSDAKIKLVKSIAAKHGINLDSDIFESNSKCDMLLAHYPVVEPIKVGNCPNCNAVVFQKEWIKTDTGEVKCYFTCEKSGKAGKCTFTIWDSKIEAYFSDRKFSLLSLEERRDALKKILSLKKGYLFSGLVSESNITYNAKISVASFTPKGADKEIWFLKEMKGGKSSASSKKSTPASMNQKRLLAAQEGKKAEPIREVTINTDLDNELLKKIKELEKDKLELEKINTIDSLTGAYNRAALDKDMNMFWEKGIGHTISLAFIDGDKFKNINDTFGHDGGDEVLKGFVISFKEITQSVQARVYKFGGDEFCILLREPHEIVKSVMTSIKSFVNANPIKYKEHEINATFSAGVALCHNGIDSKDLLILADKMLYKSKEGGRNNIGYSK